MIGIRSTRVGLLALLVLGLSQGAAKAINEKVDFRDYKYAGAFDSHTVNGVVGGVDFTVSAFRGKDRANLWWDPTDGLGIRGGTNDDEIDSNERMTIDFASAVGISHLTFSDLFMNEMHRGKRIQESGYLILDSDAPLNFAANRLVAQAAGNGEYVLDLGGIFMVNSMTLGASGEGSDFALQGFTDPPLDDTTQPGERNLQQPFNSVPEPGVIALLGAGLLALGSAARRRKKS